MAITLVTSKSDGTTGTNPTGPLGGTATAGNLLVACLTHLGPGSGITAPFGWTTRYSTSGSPTVWIVEKIAAGGETDVTFTDVASVFYEIETYEFAGAASSGEFDAAAAGGSGVLQTSGQPGSITPAVGNEVFVLAVAQAAGNGGSEAIDSGFTILDASSFTDSVHGYKIKTNSTAENPTASWTSARNWVGGMVAFKPAGTVTPITPTGTVTPGGALLKTCGKVLSGTVTPGGALRRTVGKVLVGTTTPAGALTKSLTHTFLLFLTGSVAPAGRVLKTVVKALVGLIAGSGSLRIGANPYVPTPTTVRGSSGTSSVTGPDGRSSTVEI